MSAVDARGWRRGRAWRRENRAGDGRQACHGARRRRIEGVEILPDAGRLCVCSRWVTRGRVARPWWAECVRTVRQVAVPATEGRRRGVGENV